MKNSPDHVSFFAKACFLFFQFFWVEVQFAGPLEVLFAGSLVPSVLDLMGHAHQFLSHGVTCAFWLIWFINQRALHNHACLLLLASASSCIGVSIGICTHLPLAQGYTQKLYIWCTCAHMSLINAHQIFSDFDFLNGSHFGIFL